MTFKALTDTVRSQGNAISELEKQITNKASKVELNSGLNIKANVADVMRSFSEITSNIENKPSFDEVQSYLDEKISKADFQHLVVNKANIDDVRHMIDTKLNNVHVNEDLNTLNMKIDDLYKEFTKKLQSFTTEFSDSLSSKANKEQFTGFLHRKANKTDMEITLKNKVDLSEFQNLVHQVNQKLENIDYEKFSNKLETKADKFEFNNLANIVNYKIDKKELDNVYTLLNDYKRETDNRLQTNDEDFERLIENVKLEFKNNTSDINNLDSNYNY